MPRWREQRSLFGEILDWMLAPLLLLICEFQILKLALVVEFPLFELKLALSLLIMDSVSQESVGRLPQQSDRRREHRDGCAVNQRVCE